MLNLVLGILVLSFLVLIHELGHFLAAKGLKIPVLSFSIGFGKPFFRKKIGETEYRLSPIPFGGYVEMEGESPSSEDATNPNGFSSRPIWQRALVAIAGPAFNIISAFIFLFLMYLIGVARAPYLDTTVVGAITENSIAAEYMQVGDTILTINGEVVEDWEMMSVMLGDLNPEHEITFVRGTDTLTHTLIIPLPDPKTLQSSGSGIFPPIPPVIGSIAEGSAAEEAGLAQGDSVLAINGTAIASWYALVDMVAQYDSTAKTEESKETQALTTEASLDSTAPIMQATLAEESVPAQTGLELTIKRGDEVITQVLTPSYNEEHQRFMIGVVVENPETEIVRYSIPEAFVRAWNTSIEYTAQIFDVLKKLVTRLISPEYLSGPIGIMQISGAAVQAGISPLLNLLALISINLGILNLMPLVITDGGMLSLLLVEAIRGKPVSSAVRQKLSYVFMALFLALFIFVTFNDIIRYSVMNTLLR